MWTPIIGVPTNYAWDIFMCLQLQTCNYTIDIWCLVHAVEQWVEALRYKPEGGRFDS